jgi:capsular polysaccharide biosynthesis protein
MELRDYFKIIGKYWLTIVGVTVVITGLTVAWSVMQPVKYESSITVAVNKPNTVPQRTAAYFQYDKYYSIQASSLYADTLSAWLSSAGTTKEIYEKAGYPVPDISIKKLGREFRPRRLPPVTLSISVVNTDRAKAEKLATAAGDVLEARTEEQRRGDDPDHYFTLISDPAVTAEVRQDLALNTLIGLVAGLILGFILAFLRDYLRRS